MKKPSSLIFLSLAVAVVASVANGVQPATNVVHASQSICSYVIEIETTCAPSAETTDVIGIRFGDLDGDLVVVKHLKNPKLLYDPKEGARKQGSVYGGFNRCAVDMFEVSGRCMSHKNVCSLYLKRFGLDGWRPGWVKVLRQHEEGSVSLVSDVFYFRRFVPQNVWFGFDYCNSNREFLPQVVNLGGET